MGEMQIVVFELNSEVYGVDTFQVKQIVKYQNVTGLPEMPPYIDGVITLRGNAIPIINLNLQFKMGETEITKKTKIIITEIDQKLIGFAVNDVPEILRLPESAIEASPSIIGKGQGDYLKLVGKSNDRLISILDLSKILPESEIKTIFENIDKINK